MKTSLYPEVKYQLFLRLSKIFNNFFCPPLEVLITLTNRCNLKCIMCNFSSHPMAKEDELKTKDIIAIVHQVADLKIKNLVFSGGEPLLRDDIFDIIKVATEKNMHTVLLTNGTILNNYIIKGINESGLKTINVSIDGLEPIHDFIRGEGNFRRSINFIEEMKNKCPGVYLSVTNTIMNFNLESLPDMLFFLEKLEIRQISLQPVVPDNTNWEIKQKDDMFWIPTERLSLLNKIVEEVKLFKRRNDIIANDYCFLELIKHHFGIAMPRQKPNINCYEGFRRFTITAGGRIWICGTEMKGNIVNEGIKRCWRSTEVIKKRKDMSKCRKFCLQACAFERNNQRITDLAPLFLKLWLRKLYIKDGN